MTDDLPPPMPQSQQNDAYLLQPPDKPLGFFSTIESVLRNPGSIVYHFQTENPLKVMSYLLLLSIGNLLVFGVIVGTFSMGDQLWAAPLKIVAGFLFSGLICLPSLFIFSNISGTEIRFSLVAGMLTIMQAITSLMLLGFAPVVWIFSQSTDLLIFIGPLNLVVWLIALWFGFSSITKAVKAIGNTQSSYVGVWIFIFFLVILQVSTSLRPIIGSDEKFFNEEKKFFLQHWVESLDEGANENRNLMEAQARYE